MSRYISVTEYVKKKRWCNQNGWSEPFYQDGRWYAFPPGAVIPQKIPRQPLALFYLSLREIVPIEPPPLKTKKLQHFVNHYRESKIWLKDEEREKAYVASQMAHFTSTEKIELEQYLAAKVKQIDIKARLYFIKFMGIIIMLAGCGWVFTSLFDSILLFWFFPLILFILIRCSQEYFQLLLANLDERSSFEGLLLFVQDI